MFSFFNIFKKKNSKKEEEAFALLRKASVISKKIAEETNDARLKGLAFELKRSHDEAIKIFEEIDYDLKKLDKFYFDPKQAFSENYKKVESILDKFNKRIA
ncbi:MAG: hypothetical protein ISQ17_02905 [Pelagibacteraceae bacterium]|nr:hypothetical protein [Pelagibacteraceae bacterium]